MLYIPSTIKTETEKELLRTAIWADTKWTGFWQISSVIKKNQKSLKRHSHLDSNPEFLIQFRMYVHPKNLKSERNTP